ncbi:signal peptidase I [Streptomyces laurentii]|uniref:signal peptidase I n=1 Tax=Streptomyces laurentii TaxID=39478 RepID=UPI0036AF7509
MRSGRGLRIAGLTLAPLGVLLIAAGFLLRVAYPGHTVQGTSMEPAYGPGDTLLAERVEPSGIRRGDVVLVSAPEWGVSRDLLVRRVIGVGGDRIRGEGGRLSVNGRPLTEPYVARPDDPFAAGPDFEVTVPEGRLFLLGDNRANSHDARDHADGPHQGTLPVAAARERVASGPLGAVGAGAGVFGGAVVLLAGLGLGAGGLRAGRAGPRVAPAWQVP